MNRTTNPLAPVPVSKATPIDYDRFEPTTLISYYYSEMDYDPEDRPFYNYKTGPRYQIAKEIRVPWGPAVDLALNNERRELATQTFQAWSAEKIQRLDNNLKTIEDTIKNHSFMHPAGKQHNPSSELFPNHQSRIDTIHNGKAISVHKDSIRINKMELKDAHALTKLADARKRLILAAPIDQWSAGGGTAEKNIITKRFAYEMQNPDLDAAHLINIYNAAMRNTFLSKPSTSDQMRRQSVSILRGFFPYASKDISGGLHSKISGLPAPNPSSHQGCNYRATLAKIILDMQTMACDMMENPELDTVTPIIYFWEFKNSGLFNTTHCQRGVNSTQMDRFRQTEAVADRYLNTLLRERDGLIRLLSATQSESAKRFLDVLIQWSMQSGNSSDINLIILLMGLNKLDINLMGENELNKILNATQHTPSAPPHPDDGEEESKLTPLAHTRPVTPAAAAAAAENIPIAIPIPRSSSEEKKMDGYRR